VSAEVGVLCPKYVKCMFVSVFNYFEGVDILIGHAAFPLMLQDNALDTWNRALEGNHAGTFLVSHAAVVPMLAQGGDEIIDIYSTYGFVGLDQVLYEREGYSPEYSPVFHSIKKAIVRYLLRYDWSESRCRWRVDGVVIAHLFSLVVLDPRGFQFYL
jgi:NAD(P)-dependent dehydrogenase (short-subunit alcohol dehydrogenase family)